jgi:CBS domain-containing protein
MFGLSGVDGEFFRGTLEEMVRTQRVGATRPARGIEREEGEPMTAVEAGPGHDDRRYHAAAAAYAAARRAAPDRGPVYHAYQVMSRRVVTLAPATPVDAAWRALAAHDIGQAPVANAQGRIVGLVSRAHLLHVLNEHDGRLSDVRARTVAEVMATPVVTVEPVVDVRRVAEALLAWDLPALPVVDADSGALVGIVSRSDILRCLVTDPPLTLWA